MTRAFQKVEGLGNDFILFDTKADEELDASEVRRLCDRRFGIGADGVLLVTPARSGGDARMRVYNADGSVPEMCGNGVRCVALYVAERRRVDSASLVVETDAGLRRCDVERSGATGTVEVDMGSVRVVGDLSVVAGGVPIALTLADAGNPHAIAYRDDPEADLERFGATLSTDPAFKNGCNIEFVRWQGAVINVAVWERGAGRTLACGTGACAVVAVACARGEVNVGAWVRVRLPGGELAVRHDPATGATRMRGPARQVFHGEWHGHPL